MHVDHREAAELGTAVDVDDCRLIGLFFPYLRTLFHYQQSQASEMLVDELIKEDGPQGSAEGSLILRYKTSSQLGASQPDTPNDTP